MRDARDDLANELALRELVSRYADAATRLDAAGIADAFTADGEWEAARLGRYRGREAMLPFFASMLEGWQVFVQTISSGRVVFDPADPDRARGRWYVLEVGLRTTGEELSVTGVYHDAYLRDMEGWRIARRRYDPLLSRRGERVVATPFPADVPQLD